MLEAQFWWPYPFLLFLVVACYVRSWEPIHLQRKQLDTVFLLQFSMSAGQLLKFHICHDLPSVKFCSNDLLLWVYGVCKLLFKYQWGLLVQIAASELFPCCLVANLRLYAIALAVFNIFSARTPSNIENQVCQIFLGAALWSYFLLESKSQECILEPRSEMKGSSTQAVLCGVHLSCASSNLVDYEKVTDSHYDFLGSFLGNKELIHKIY